MATKSLIKIFAVGALVVCGAAYLLYLRLGEVLKDQGDSIIALTALSTISLISLGVASIAIMRLQKNLHRTAEALAWVTSQASAALSQINTHAESLADSAHDQATAVQQTFNATEQVDKSAQKTSQYVNECHAFSTNARSIAEMGKKALGAVITAFSDIDNSTIAISQQVEQANQNYRAIVDTINQISAKTKVINDIVFQTKLLSFNASVEAARAGEHGKGFAVVAEQIGSLAQTSGHAAKEISALLAASSNHVEEIVRSTSAKLKQVMSENTGKIDAGKTLTNQCNIEFEKINQSVTQLDTLISQIADLSSSQTISMHEINQSMAHIANSADKAAANNSETTKHIFAMRQYINQFSAVTKSVDALASGKHVVAAKAWEEAAQNDLIMVKLAK